MIFIVIPVFNRWEFTNACLESLHQQSFSDYKIIVVDHGSTDNTSLNIKNNYENVVLINGDESMWWTAATNLGIERAIELSTHKDDYLLVLNNDLVVEPNYLNELLSVSKNNQPCVVGSLSVDIENPGRVDFAGVKWNSIFATYKKAKAVDKPNQLHLPTDLLPGRGTLYPISAFIDFGLFDVRNFPHYAADEDFSLLCKRNGYKLLVGVNAIVKSHVKSTGGNVKHHKMSMKHFIKTLSSVRSANNLSVRLRWAKKNSPLPYFYFVFDTIQIFGSFLKSRLN